MPETLDLKNVVEDIIFSCDKRIESITSIFDASLSILSNFPESITNIKEKRAKIDSQVRDILSENEHFRKKDFDNMMEGILSIQDEREKEARAILKNYFNEYKEMAFALRENLSKVKDALAKGEAERIKEFQAMINGILARQEERKEEITSKLKEFQNEQQEMAKRLKELLVKGNQLRIKDLKSTLKEFKAQYKERIAHQEARRQDVNKMIGVFKQERKGTAKD